MFESYDLRVTVRFWDGEKFLAPVPDVPARRGPDAPDGRTRLAVRKGVVSPGVGSRVTGPDGTERAVEACADGLLFCVVTLGREPLSSP